MTVEALQPDRQRPASRVVGEHDTWVNENRMPPQMAGRAAGSACAIRTVVMGVLLRRRHEVGVVRGDKGEKKEEG